MADIAIKQGDTASVLDDTLSYSDGTIANLTGASVSFVMRAITSSAPATTAAATIVAPTLGTVSYQFTAADTATVGIFAGEWVVTYALGSVQRFPSDGYLEISIEENLSTVGGATLVSLGEARDYLNIQSTDRTRDAKLLRMINAVRPVVENITGPMLITQYDEWYDGGQYFVQLRHTPVVNLMAVSFYSGPTEWNCVIVQDPAHGTIYSVMLDTGGRVVRRSTGGGIIAFPAMPQAVHVVYQAGYATIPANVSEAALELLRVNFQDTQQGRPRFDGTSTGAVDDREPGGVMLGFFVPNRVRELLMPHRRFPSLA